MNEQIKAFGTTILWNIDQTKRNEIYGSRLFDLNSVIPSWLLIKQKKNS